jgi:hypothetical protein
MQLTLKGPAKSRDSLEALWLRYDAETPVKPIAVDLGYPRYLDDESRSPLGRAWYYPASGFFPTGTGFVHLDGEVFRLPGDQQIWTLHHECIHLRLMAGPLSAAWQRFHGHDIEAADAAIGLSETVAQMYLELCSKTLELAQEVGAEKYARTHCPTQYLFQRARYLVDTRSALTPRVLVPFSLYCSLVDRRLGQLMARDESDRAALAQRAHDEETELREEHPGVAGWLLGEADRVLAIDPDRDDPDPYDAVYRRLLEVSRSLKGGD